MQILNDFLGHDAKSTRMEYAIENDELDVVTLHQNGYKEMKDEYNDGYT